MTEEFFPDHDIRLIAISDGIDTDEGENELAPIRNLFNEWYSRDISKKRRISNKIRGNSGEPMSQPPYGYLKSPADPKRWIVDEDAARVVRRIYSMTLEGYGTDQIATLLERERILIPTAYWQSKGIRRAGRSVDANCCKWPRSTIIKILTMQEYCGDLINFKTYSKSYKNKKRIVNGDESRVVFKDVHEAIIERATWNKIQEKRGKIRRRKCQDGEKNMFSGLLVCADCGSNLHYHFNQTNHDIKYFNCSNYKGNHGTCDSTHYIRVDFLEQVILGEIRRLTKFASRYENEFTQAVMGHSQKAIQAEHVFRERELHTLQEREKELDKLFERLYEDNVAGKITDERFERMSERYETEQKELIDRIKALKTELDKKIGQAMTAEVFLSIVRRYTRVKKLTPRMLNELIDHIEVYQAEKVNRTQVQRLTVYYNCVGTLDIPLDLPLDEPEVLIQTRKGVAVSYAPVQQAI